MSALEVGLAVVAAAPLGLAVAGFIWALFDEFGWRAIVVVVAVCVWVAAFYATAVRGAQ